MIKKHALNILGLAVAIGGAFIAPEAFAGGGSPFDDPVNTGNMWVQGLGAGVATFGIALAGLGAGSHAFRTPLMAGGITSLGGGGFAVMAPEVVGGLIGGAGMSLSNLPGII